MAQSCQNVETHADSQNRLDVLILSARYAATNLVLLVLKAALGHASTRGNANCHVLLPVIVFPATNAARRISPADTNAQESVVKNVLKATVKSAPLNLILEWILLR